MVRILHAYPISRLALENGVYKVTHQIPASTMLSFTHEPELRCVRISMPLMGRDEHPSTFPKVKQETHSTLYRQLSALQQLDFNQSLLMFCGSFQYEAAPCSLQSEQKLQVLCERPIVKITRVYTPRTA